MIDFDDLAARLTVPDGGFTLTSYGMHVTTGYAVSKRADLEARIPVRHATERRLRAYCLENWTVLAEPGAVFGAWHNPADGQVYLDVSIVVETPRAAFALACANGQLAYFDLARGHSVPLADPRF